MKVVLDTNILISALVFGGKPREVFELAIIEGLIGIVTSSALVDELIGVLSVKFDYSDTALDSVKRLLESHFTFTNPKMIPDIIVADQSDNQVLAAALAGKVEFVVSGDQHLLALKIFENIPIVSPDQFLKLIE